MIAAPTIDDLGAFAPIAKLLTIPDNGTIVVAGAYKGKYLHYFSERFPTAKLYGFEPQRDPFIEANERLFGKAILFNAGLATGSRTVMAGNCGTDGCSAFSTHGNRELLAMLDAVEALHSIGNTIDLLVLNMEAGEWPLIPYLLNEMMHHRIASMAIQFHPEYVSKQCSERVLAQLDEYYDRAYMDWPAWTYFTKKVLTSATG